MLGELAGMKCVRFVSDLAPLPRELKIQQGSLESSKWLRIDATESLASLYSLGSKPSIIKEQIYLLVAHSSSIAASYDWAEYCTSSSIPLQ